MSSEAEGAGTTDKPGQISCVALESEAAPAVVHESTGGTGNVQALVNVKGLAGRSGCPWKNAMTEKMGPHQKRELA